MRNIDRIEALERKIEHQSKKFSEMEKSLSITGKQIQDLQNKTQQLSDAVVLGKMPQF